MAIAVQTRSHRSHLLSLKTRTRLVWSSMVAKNSNGSAPSLPESRALKQRKRRTLRKKILKWWTLRKIVSKKRERSPKRLAYNKSGTTHVRIRSLPACSIKSWIQKDTTQIKMQQCYRCLSCKLNMKTIFHYQYPDSQTLQRTKDSRDFQPTWSNV